MKIDYQSKKWEKEIQKIISFKKEVKGNLFCNLELVISKHLNSDFKDYMYTYVGLSGCYEQLSRRFYLDNQINEELINFTYLSGIALLYTQKMYEIGVKTEFDYIVNPYLNNMDNIIYKLISVNETEFDIFKDKNNIIKLLFNKEYDKASEMINKIPDESDSSMQIEYMRPEDLKKIYQAIIDKNEKIFNEEMIKRIKKYRKNMVGYCPIIDIVSIALIKIAKKAGLNYTFDVIEIPKMYFDETYKIDKEKVKLPFYEEFVKEGIIKEEWGR